MTSVSTNNLLWASKPNRPGERAVMTERIVVSTDTVDSNIIHSWAGFGKLTSLNYNMARFWDMLASNLANEILAGRL
jgi:hypothetical protein